MKDSFAHNKEPEDKFFTGFFSVNNTSISEFRLAKNLIHVVANETKKLDSVLKIDGYAFGQDYFDERKIQVKTASMTKYNYLKEKYPDTFLAETFFIRETDLSEGYFSELQLLRSKRFDDYIFFSTFYVHNDEEGKKAFGTFKYCVVKYCTGLQLRRSLESYDDFEFQSRPRIKYEDGNSLVGIDAIDFNKKVDLVRDWGSTIVERERPRL